MASIAVFVALGGTTYAAITLPKNSVGAKQIKKNGVGASEIKRNAVGSSEVKTDAIASSEIRSGAVAGDEILDSGVGGAEIADNAVGGTEIGDGQVSSSELAGASVLSAKIADGTITEDDLVAGLLDIAITVQRTDVALADNTSQAVEASCLPGTKAIAGGSSVDQTGSDDIMLLVSRPGNGGFIPDDGEPYNDWRAVYRNPAGGTGAAEIRAFVICAEIP